MRKARLAICMEDSEYQERFVKFLMEYCRESYELYVYSQKESFMEEEARQVDALLVDEGNLLLCKTEKCFCLTEEKNAVMPDTNIRGIYKYQDMNLILQELELNSIKGEETSHYHQADEKGAKLLATYSFSAGDLQLLFWLTMASILSENQSVLLIDLQENSGFRSFLPEERNAGLEEVLVRLEKGNYSDVRLNEYITKTVNWDYIYPARSSECICSTQKETFGKLFDWCKEQHYEYVLVNLGFRFEGFYAFLENCEKVYLIQRMEAPTSWRDNDFLEEAGHMDEELLDKIIKIPLSIRDVSGISQERLIEAWKWSEIGDEIRRQCSRRDA